MPMHGILLIKLVRSNYNYAMIIIMYCMPYRGGSIEPPLAIVQVIEHFVMSIILCAHHDRVPGHGWCILAASVQRAHALRAQSLLCI